VRNVSSTPLSGSFTFTFFQGGTIVGRRMDQPRRYLGGRPSLCNSSARQDFAGRFRYQFQWTLSSDLSRISGTPSMWIYALVGSRISARTLDVL